MHIVFAHFLRTTNIGDRIAGPYNYFDFGDATREVVSVHDLSPAHARRADMVVIGGGAVAGSIRKVWEVAKRPRIVAWGVGQTKHGAISRHVAPAARLYDLYGSRELPLQPGEDWVPCPSCMHPALSATWGAPAKRHVGLYINSDPGILGRYPIPDSLRSLPKFTNRNSIEDALWFLATTETILTNSYHGAYWGQLLGRRVILVGAYSAKFYGYKYQPPVWTSGAWEALADEAEVPVDALEEARMANNDFYAKVMGGL